MQYKKKLIIQGNSLHILIPKDLADYLKLSEGSEVILQDDEGKHGRFVSFWKKKGR